MTTEPPHIMSSSSELRYAQMEETIKRLEAIIVDLGSMAQASRPIIVTQPGPREVHEFHLRRTLLKHYLEPENKDLFVHYFVVTQKLPSGGREILWSSSTTEKEKCDNEIWWLKRLFNILLGEVTFTESENEDLYGGIL